MPAANRASPDLLVGNGVLDAGHAWTEAYIVATAVAQLKRCRPRLGAATVIRVWPAGAARLCRAPQGPTQLLPPAAVTTTMEGAVRGRVDRDERRHRRRWHRLGSRAGHRPAASRGDGSPWQFPAAMGFPPPPPSWPTQSNLAPLVWCGCDGSVCCRGHLLGRRLGGRI